MNKFASFMGGMLVGGIIGAAVALLYSPASGKEMQQRITHSYEDIREGVLEAAETRRKELTTQLADLRK